MLGRTFLRGRILEENGDHPRSTRRAELTAVHAAMLREHPEWYAAKAHMQLSATRFRDQITAPARTILLVLLAAAGVVFVIACSNVANLILARSVRREGELAIRAALGAGTGALRRTLLAESLVLCGAGAVLGVLLARPFVAVVARYAARFSVRALDVTVDASVLWVGAGLAMAAAVLLAYVPTLPSAHAPTGLGLVSGGVRITSSTSRRLRVFAVAQIALSFVLLAGAGMLVATLIALQSVNTGYDTRQVLVLDVPSAVGDTSARGIAFYQEMARRIGDQPGVEGVALGTFVPWRDAGSFGPGFPFTVEGYSAAQGEENPYGRLRVVSPGFFAVLGVPLVAGRDFTAEDRRGNEPVVIVSQSVAQRLFPNGDALNHHLTWTDPLFGPPEPRRIVGVVTDVDDENVVQGPALTVYHPFQQTGVAGRVFVHTSGDPYALVPTVRRIVRELSPNQPVDRAATLEDVRAEVLAPARLNAFVMSGFAAVALLIAVVGVAGVLAFSVSARTRELGVRLAIGATPRALMMDVLAEGVLIVSAGIAAGTASGYAFAGLAAGWVANVRLPGAMPALCAAAGPRRRRRHRLAHARRASVARGRPAGTPIGVMQNMPMAQTDPPTPRSPLRLWPGVVAAVLLLLARFVVPLALPDAGAVGVIGGVACAAGGRRVVAVLQPGALVRAPGRDCPDGHRARRDVAPRPRVDRGRDDGDDAAHLRHPAS